MEDLKIGDSLARFQAALKQAGGSMGEFVYNNYVQKWGAKSTYYAMSIRTTFVNAMHNFLTKKGLLNMERVSLSPVTDPLAHDIEHSPTIHYKGLSYKTTHSMIYSKFLACFNPYAKGIFVDSPNIRLELESPNRQQRGKYLIDFSQMDIEFRRKHYISLNDYYNNPQDTIEKLNQDKELALSFFEELIVDAVTQVVTYNQEALQFLGVALEIPKRPFPRISCDEAVAKTKTKAFEMALGKTMKSQFFWVTGLMRENYDLIYPYLYKDGTKRALSDFSSNDIYNYDLCAQSLQLDGTYGGCYEVLSGALREWLYEPIVQRLLDNKILKVAPVFNSDGEIDNIDELEGYGPFLIAAKMKDASGNSFFPATAGGGLGIERTLYALLNGPVIKKVDDITLFGKNPDSFPIYLY